MKRLPVTRYIGERFGYLVVEGVIRKNNASYFIVKCDCGNTKEILANSVKTTTKNCGCKTKEIIARNSTKHGLHNDRLYNIYYGMRARCTNKNNPRYHRYGGRGIVICNEWLISFENFKDWAYSSGYKNDLTIERINNDSNYEPSNCKWIPAKDQLKNKTRGSAKGENNKKAKLKAKEIPEIRYLLNKNFQDSEIGRMYGVTGECIRAIKIGKSWRTVK
ncbi:hypothetical protein OCA16_25990 [Bacillus cereus]|nr:hypothetical protein [Bacillus cereus]